MKHLFRAVFVVTFFTMIDRVLGFGFKVFLSRELGAINMGIYQVALSVFFVLLTFTTSGTPLVVSKFTAIFSKKGDKNSEHAMVMAALIVGIIVSIIICGIFFFFQVQIAGLFAAKESMNLILLLLPAVIFSGIYASFRGNLWGNGKYATVSIIELIEQVVRIGSCILLILLGFNQLRMTAISLSIAFGVTALCCVAAYCKNKGKFRSPSGQFKPLLHNAVPVTLIRASNTVVNSLIAISVPFLLTVSGLSTAESLAVFGASVGMAMPLLFLPLTAVGSLAYVLIPTLSAAHASGDKVTVKKQVEQATLFALVVSSIFVPVFFALGNPIGLFVYNNADAGRFLRLSAFLLIPMSAESIVSSMMNSLDLEKKSFINYMIGSVIMFIIMFASWRNFRIELLVVGLGISWTISTTLDVIDIKKRTGIEVKIFLIPLFKCILLIVPTIFLISWLSNILGALHIFWQIAIPAVIGVLLYCTAGLLLGIVDKSLFFKRGKKRENGQIKTGVNKIRGKRKERFKDKQPIV
ncbi:MAG: oligosaccharide flippase family protein [Firmicutes bacterium]|nr:oligosaccharide flippase family protein [Bacillota bacterium]